MKELFAILDKEGKGEIKYDDLLAQMHVQTFDVIRMALRQNGMYNGSAMQSAYELFQAMDTDGGGSLDHDEFQNAMQQLGVELSSSQIDEAIAVIDKDGDGALYSDRIIARIIVCSPVYCTSACTCG